MAKGTSKSSDPIKASASIQKSYQAQKAREASPQKESRWNEVARQMAATGSSPQGTVQLLNSGSNSTADATKGRGTNSYTRQDIADQQANRNYLAETMEASNGQRRSNNEYQKQKEKTSFLDEAMNGREAAEKAAQGKARNEYQLKQKDNARQSAADATAEADRLEAEMRGRYGDNPVATSEEEATAIANTEKQIADLRSKADEEFSKVNTTNSKRDAALEEYLKAVDTERTIADGATILNQAELDAASADRKQKEEALKELNRSLGNDEYFGLVDEAQSRDLFEGWAGERAAGSAATIGTGLEWLGDKLDNVSLTTIDPETGEEREIWSGRDNALTNAGQTLFNAAQGWQGQAQENWASGTSNMSETEKQIAGLGKTAADMTMDMIENFIVPGAGRVAMAARVAGGGALTQAGRERNDVDARMTKAVLDGAVAFLSEYLLGGAEKVYGKSIVGKGLEKMFGKASPVLKTVLNTEGLEEGLEYALGYLGDRLLKLDPNGEWSGDELKQNMLVGYIMGVLFNGIAGGIEYTAPKIRAGVDEAIDAVSQNIPPQEAAQMAMLEPDENVKIDPSKQIAEPEAEATAEPEPVEAPQEAPQTEPGTDLKTRQFEIIQNSNAAPDDNHTWVRSADEIKTFAEAVNDSDYDGGDIAPDFTRDMIRRAEESGEITVYSSNDIREGTFVTPSRMEAESYAGGGDVYSKTIPIDHVAWIDGIEGQYTGNAGFQKETAETPLIKRKDVIDSAKLKGVTAILKKGDREFIENAIKSRNPKDYIENYWNSKAQRVRLTKYFNAAYSNPAMLLKDTDVAKANLLQTALSPDWIYDSDAVLFRLLMEQNPDGSGTEFRLADWARENGLTDPGDIEWLRSKARGLSVNYPELLNYTDTNDLDTLSIRSADEIERALIGEPKTAEQQTDEESEQASATETAAETEANESESAAEPEQEANDTGKQNENKTNASTDTKQDQNQQNQQGEKKEQSRKTDHTKKTTKPNDETDAEFDKLNTKYGSIDKGEKAARDINVPKKDGKGMKVGEGARTIFEADATPDERVASLKAAVVNGNFGHIPVSNDVRSKNAVKKLAKDGWSRSVSDFLAAVDTGKVDADTIALGAHLLNEAGNSTECSGKQYVELCMAYNDAVSGSAKALAAGRILKTLTPEGKLYGMEKTIEKMNKEIRKNNEGKKASKQKAEIKLNEKLVEDYLNAKTEEERGKIQDKLVKDTAAQVPNTFRDKFTALRYLNMLGNFKTQVRNFAGNTGMTVVQKVKNEARGGIEGIVKAATGGKYDQQYKGGPGLAKRLKVASEDFVSDADLQALAMGEKKFSDVAKQSEAEIKDAKDPFSNKNPLGKFLNAYSKATNKAMEFGDLIFVRANYADALAGYMNAHNISEADWKAMVNDPAKSAEVDKARAFAIKQAQEATFRDTNAVSKFAATFDSRWPGMAKKVAQGVIPFRKTPANVLVRMEEYSPLGIVNTGVKAFQAKKGKAEISDVIDSFAKTATGSSLAILGYFLASRNRARTKDDDKNEEAFAKLKGQQDYSVEVTLPEFLGGGRQSVTMDWLSPASAPFFMGVEAYKLSQDGDLRPADFLNVAMSLTNPMLEMSMLSGVNDAISNLSDFEGDNSAIAQFVLNSSWSYLTQGISNTMLGQMEQFSEKYRQTYYTDKDNPLLPTWAQKKVAKFMNKTPLPKYGDYQAADYIDAWGRKQANDPNLAERAWNVFLNPGYVSKMDQKATEADAVIENLLEFSKTQKERDDFPNVVPRTPSRNETVNGKKLSPEEYDVFATTKGQESLKAVTELSKSDVFKGMDEFAQGEAIHAVYEYAEFLAASKIAKSRGETYTDTRFDGLEDTDHPAIVVGAKAGFNDAMNHENWSGVDSLLKAANSGKMSDADREFLEDNVDRFWKYSDAAADGLKAQTLNSFDSGVKDLYTSEHRTAENGGDVLDTVVDQYNSGKISLKEADALMGREDRRNEGKIREQLDYELNKVGKGDDVEKIWSMLQQFDAGEIDKPAIVKEAIKNVPKKDQARIKNVITNWTKTRARAGFGRTTVYNAMRNASDDYTPADIQKFWEIVDANGDGTLSKTEYKNKKSKIPKEYRDDVTKYLYDAMGWK